jgi:hypothetical protein
MAWTTRTYQRHLTHAQRSVLLGGGRYEYAWWGETDMGRESGPTLQREFNHYVLIAQAAVVGPDRFLPHVLICVPDERALIDPRPITAGPEPGSCGLQLSSRARRTVTATGIGSLRIGEQCIDRQAGPCSLGVTC